MSNTLHLVHSCDLLPGDDKLVEPRDGTVALAFQRQRERERKAQRQQQDERV